MLEHVPTNPSRFDLEQNLTSLGSQYGCLDLLQLVVCRRLERRVWHISLFFDCVRIAGREREPFYVGRGLSVGDWTHLPLIVKKGYEKETT